MKTAISLPDPLFARIEAMAAEQGVSRSAFLARAAELYLERLDDDSLVERINAAIAAVGDPRDEWVIHHNDERLAAEAETERW